MTDTQREIKFRAWDKNPNCPYPMIANPLQRCDAFDVLNKKSIYKDWVLMQFTGLLDKNGKEIYFGDILQTSNSDDSDGSDLWKPEDFGYTVVVENPDELGVDFTGWVVGDDESVYSTLFVEIIGNIYENPELLKD